MALIWQGLMENLTDPAIEGFTPLSTYRVRGIGYVGLQGPSGVKLDVSQQGLDALETSAGLSGLLGRMGTFIAEHDGYKEPGTVLQTEPVDVLMISHAMPAGSSSLNINTLAAMDPVATERSQSVHLASVYHPHHAPNAVIKAYDEELRLAPVQFYLGAWLHRQFKLAASNVHFPEQFAMFTAPGGHRSIVMEHIPGENLYNLGERLETQEGHSEEVVDRFVSSIRWYIRKESYKLLGERGLLIMCDLKNAQNIILDANRPIDLSKPFDRPINVIDQPSIALPMAAMRHTFQRTLSKRRWQGSQKPATLPQPSSSTV